MPWFWVIASTVLAWPRAAVLAQVSDLPPETGKIVKRTFVSSWDGAEVTYALWLPDAYTPERAWPLIVFLHGSAEGGDWEAPTKLNASIPVCGVMRDLQWIVVFPLMRGSVTTQLFAERDVLETIDDLRRDYNIDADRIHLTGLSLGGFAAFQLACHYPDRFASISVFCGGGQPALAINLFHIPTRIYHGDADEHVDVGHARDMVAAMHAARLHPEYVEMPGVGHVCWRHAYASVPFYRWFEDKKRPTEPNRIRYRTFTLRHPTAYWATIASMVDPAKPAMIDVFAPGDGAVHAHRENVGELWLRVPPSLLGDASMPTFYVDGTRQDAKRIDDAWQLRLPGVPEGQRIKRPGLSGPIQDVFYDSFLIVRPSPVEPEQAKDWEAVMAKAMAWTGELTYKRIGVIRDADVTTDIMLQHHLIVFGTPQTNTLIAQTQALLPVQWDQGRLRADELVVDGVGAVAMIYPNPLAPSRYLVTIVGRPAMAAVLAERVLRPATLSPPPLEDLVLLGEDGRWLLGTPEANGNEQPSRLNAIQPPRGPMFDSTWRLRPETIEALRALAQSAEARGS